MIQGATFALGATSFEYKKEIPLMAKFVVTSSLLGFDKKWVSYELLSLISVPRRDCPLWLGSLAFGRS